MGRWLLPWACVLVLSGSLAQAAERALIGSAAHPPVELVMTTEFAPSTGRAGMLATAGTRWVLLASDGEVGSAVVCLAASDVISTDVLYVRPGDLPQRAAQVGQTVPDDTTPS